MNYRLDIQVLRGMAVLFVVLFHFKIDYFDNGFLGVDIFFVLSGYLMAQLYNKGTILDFYKRRLKRLLPAYVATLGITTFAVSVVAIPPDARQQYDQLLFDFFGLSNIGFWLHNSYFASSTFKPLLNLWSLGLELQFYLIVPLLLPLVHRYKFLLIVALGVSLLLALYVTSVSPKHSFFLLPFRVWEFLLGAFAAWSNVGHAKKERGLLVSTLLIAALLCLLFYPIQIDSASAVTGHPGLAALLVCMMTAVILVRPLHSVFSDQNSVGKALVVLGEYSYSIYLVHFPIIVLFNYEELAGTHLGYSNVSSLLIMVLCTAFASILMFNYVESIRSSNHFTKRFLVVVFASVLLILAGIAWNNFGYSETQRKVFAAWQDKGVWRCGKVFRVLNYGEHVCPLSEITPGKNILFVGNSHADSIKDALSTSLSDYDIGTYFYVHNTPLQGSVVNADVLSNDVDRLGVDAVIFHYSLTFYDNKTYREQLFSAITSLAEKNIASFLIAPVPTYNFHVPKTLYEKSMATESSIQTKTVEEYFSINQIFFNFITEHQLSNNLYMTHEILCSTGECLIEKDHHPLYYDKDHLTLTGANLLKPVFDHLANRIKGQ